MYEFQFILNDQVQTVQSDNTSTMYVLGGVKQDIIVKYRSTTVFIANRQPILGIFYHKIQLNYYHKAGLGVPMRISSHDGRRKLSNYITTKKFHHPIPSDGGKLRIDPFLPIDMLILWLMEVACPQHTSFLSARAR